MDNHEINRLIAEKVMGWELKQMEHCSAWIDDQNGWVLKQMWKPSTNIQDAWLVVERVSKEKEWRVIIEYSEFETEVKFKNKFGRWKEPYSINESGPMAICLAALKAVGVEVTP